MTHAAIVALLLLAPLAAVHAQTPGTEVAGRVIDADRREPVSGATVRASGRGWSREAVTGPDGRYRIAVLRAQVVRLRVVRLGYHPVEVELRVGSLGASLDLVLEAHPLEIAPLQVLAARAPAAMASLEEGLVEAPQEERSLAAASAEMMPSLPPPGPVAEERREPGGGGGAGAPASVRVVGSTTRHGAAFLGDAPVQLAGSLSPVFDPFAGSGYAVRVIDGGAPARVTGGAEYVLELDPAAAATPGQSGSHSLIASVDAIAAAARVRASGGRAEASASARLLMPWNELATGEPGHEGGELAAALRVAPVQTQVVSATVLVRSEGVPVPGATAATSWSDAGASLRHDLRVGDNALAWGVGTGRFRADLPLGHEEASGRPLLAQVDRDQLRVGAELRRPIGGRAAVGAGADLLQQTVRRRTPSRTGEDLWRSGSVVAGAFADVAAEVSDGFVIRGGLRADRLTGDHASTRVAPRLALHWSPTSNSELELGAGRYHQALPVADTTGAGEDGFTAPSRLARGDHFSLDYTRAAGALALRGRLHHKRLRDLPLAGAVDVWGGAAAIGMDAPGANANLAYGIERRSTRVGARWIAHTLMASASADAPLGIETRLRTTFSTGAGLTGVSVLSDPDTGVVVAGVVASDDAAAAFEGIRIDIELSRPFAIGAGADGTLTPYLRLVNAAGGARRRVLSEDVEAGTRAPRVLVVGFSIGRLAASRTEPLAR